GISNWSEDYFKNTVGMALVVHQPPLYAGDPESSGATVQAQLQQVFERDWGSAYSPLLS
ncbi:hypothetical protein NQD34_018333, partial [Periophthalmus magnuspinnatus]